MSRIPPQAAPTALPTPSRPALGESWGAPLLAALAALAAGGLAWRARPRRPGWAMATLADVEVGAETGAGVALGPALRRGA